MKCKSIILIAVMILCADHGLYSQAAMENTLIIYADQGKDTISRHLYGHFSEHLGRCIYGGIWVGEDSPIPNTRGIRNDVAAALKHLKIPNLRWPGGCFADEYHWKDGIGPRSTRPKMVNTNWGGVTEDNSFGTHEFLDLCEQIGAEPIICGNIGSGTVKEMSDWVQYVNSDGENPMSALRKANGREKPWKVHFWCVGNETWGCGGIMSADHYAGELGRYSYFLKNYGSTELFKIASGGLESDYQWTETIMKKWNTAGGWLQGFMSGYSLHYYTVCHDWNSKGSATLFNETDWFTTLSKTLKMEELILQHSAVMDKYDSQKKIGLVVDEWGNWHDVEPGTNPGFLYQQNTMRDAIVAALNLNIFNNHCDRVRMANIAQVVNVLQAVILADQASMILTPTYHVFDLFKEHQNALMLPIALKCEDYRMNAQTIPAVSASASMNSAGIIHLSIVNVNPSKDITIQCSLRGVGYRTVSGKILTSGEMQDHNTSEQPEKVKIKEFIKCLPSGDGIRIEIPSKSIITLELK